MLRARAATTVSPIDAELIVAALPELARLWRGLEFHNGMVIDRRGRRREGLRVEAGTHPHTGTRYCIVTPLPDVPGDEMPAADMDEAATPTQVRTVDVTADDLERVGLRFSEPDGAVVDVEVHRPMAPDRITGTSIVAVGGTWPFRGPMTVDVRLDLAALPAVGDTTDRDEPQLVVELRHKRLRVRATALAAVAGDRWDLTFDFCFAGRGLARPLLRSGTPIVSRILRREIKGAVDELPGQVEAFNRELARLSGRPATPTNLAVNVLDLFLAEVVDTVPSSRLI